MKYIKTTNGGRVIVNDEDFDFLNHWKWRIGPFGYAIRTQHLLRGKKNTNKTKTILIHRVIMNAPFGIDVDHINHNRLDCRKINMRLCTRGENGLSKVAHKNKIIPYKGVYFEPRLGKYRVLIGVNYKSKHIGLFVDIKDAARAYNEAAKKYFGKFAYLNTI